MSPPLNLVIDHTADGMLRAKWSVIPSPQSMQAPDLPLESGQIALAPDGHGHIKVRPVVILTSTEKPPPENDALRHLADYCRDSERSLFGRVIVLID